jgi:hypothetical protein
VRAGARDWRQIFGRLADGVSIGQASAEASAVGRQLEVENPATNRNIGAEVQDFNKFHLNAQIRIVMQALLGGVTFVLLMALTSEQLSEYGGAYYSEELDITYQIVVEDGKLLIKVRNAPRGSLSSQSKDEFGLLGATFSFVRNDRRQITGFVLSGGRAKGIQFVRKAN